MSKRTYDPIMLVGRFYSELSFLIDTCEKLEECGHADAVPDNIRQVLKTIQPPVVRANQPVGEDGTGTQSFPNTTTGLGPAINWKG